MITESMVMKGLQVVGAWTIGTKVLGPAAATAGKFVGHCAGSLVNQMTKGRKSRKGKVVSNDQAQEQAIMALLAECDKALAEKPEQKETALTVVSEMKPEPKFDQHMSDWIQRCKDQYGGFANVVLD